MAGKELQDRDLLQVSFKLTKEADVKNLGSFLEVADESVSAILYDKKGEIQMAAHEVLKMFLTSQGDRREAYVKLWNALMDLNLGLIAKEVLKQPPTGAEGQNTTHTKSIATTTSTKSSDTKITEGRELHDGDILELSKKFIKKSDVQNLGIQLGLSNTQMQASFNEHGNNLQGAAHDIIHEWFKTQIDDHKAYSILCNALTHPKVNLRRIAAQVLDYKIPEDP